MLASEVAHWNIDAVDRDEVLRYLGYKGQELGSDLNERLNAVIQHCIEVCHPMGVLRLFDVLNSGDKSVALVDGPVLAGNDIALFLHGARTVAVVAVTLGLACEREIARLGHVSALDQAIFDAASSALVERAADAAEARVIAIADERGLFCTDRYAPGYGDLPLDVQDDIVRALDAGKRLGMSVTATHMLVPSKSETAVLGLMDEPQPHRDDRMCGVCVRKDFCTIRSMGRTCRG